MDFLFHKLSEKERQEIKKQVDDILNSFSAKLSKIGGKIEESFIEREKFERHEGMQKDNSFSREIMFKNAPQKNKDFIIAEKGVWK
jgi:Asp-tRNA(Asn)/Glu-tRNA(Gln) amidotransferase C subunit